MEFYFCAAILVVCMDIVENSKKKKEFQCGPIGSALICLNIQSCAIHKSES